MKLIVALLGLLLVSCANPYAKFYEGTPDARTSRYYEPLATPLQIYRTADFSVDQLELRRRGYELVGIAAFNAATSSVSEAHLREQATKIGAHAVLVSAKYSHTVSGAIPLTVPTTSTTQYSGTATAYGSRGTVNVYGSGTATTQGTQTTMIPYSVERSEFGAMFFAKTKARVGIISEALDDVTRKRLETNYGVRVLAIVEGTPAFHADVLAGDVVVSVGGDKVQSVQHYVELLTKYEGRAVTFSLNRDGRVIEKQIEVRAIQ